MTWLILIEGEGVRTAAMTRFDSCLQNHLQMASSNLRSRKIKFFDKITLLEFENSNGNLFSLIIECVRTAAMTRFDYLRFQESSFIEEAIGDRSS
jgi:hypothetical protein